MNKPANTEQKNRRGWLVPVALVVFTIVNTYRLATIEGDWGTRQWVVLALTVGMLYLLWREYKRR